MRGGPSVAAELKLSTQVALFYATVREWRVALVHRPSPVGATHRLILLFNIFLQAAYARALERQRQSLANTPAASKVAQPRKRGRPAGAKASRACVIM